MFARDNHVLRSSLLCGTLIETLIVSHFHLFIRSLTISRAIHVKVAVKVQHSTLNLEENRTNSIERP